MTQKEMKKMINDMASQLRLCVSALGLASDVLQEHQPKLVQFFETLIEEIEMKLHEVREME
ncbi:MAG: hypothetical protein FWC50_15100 [Planctomycetaceae bacterium]|nr:hypothetical protein [Planctomycetaceae bacterium]